jgi:hypothetical protein
VGVEYIDNMSHLITSFAPMLQAVITADAEHRRDALEDGTPDDAVAAPVVEASWYVSTPQQSEYTNAVSRMRSLVAQSPADLVAQTPDQLVTTTPEQLTAQTPADLVIDLRIADEVDRPEGIGATVASATHWATLNEMQTVDGQGTPFFFDLMTRMEPDFSAVTSLWRQMAGV